MGGPKGTTRNNGQTILTAHEKQILSIYINKRLNVFSFKKIKKIKNLANSDQSQQPMKKPSLIFFLHAFSWTNYS